MDEELEQAEKRVEEGLQRVLRQRKLVVTLQQDGHNTQQARELLRLFEEAFAVFVRSRDSIRRDLNNA
jgi:hypothetical protein